MNSTFFADLALIKQDEQQWEAYNSSRSTVVIAGPGSGKTRVLTLKAMEIMSRYHFSQFGIACLSFSRETVRELKKRLALYGYRNRSQDFVGTVHAFCISEILGPFQHIYPEYNLPDPLRIAPSKIINALYQQTLQELNYDPKRVSKIDLDRERYLSIAGQSRFIAESIPEIAQAAKVYEGHLLKSGYIDFTQIAKVSTVMIQQKDYVRRSLEAKYPWMLIDEYQDLGKALHEMVLALYGNTQTKIIAVGDMDQSIYGFQGAYPDFLEEVYNNDDFHSIRLRNNYRSNQDVITASLAALNPSPPVPDYKAKLRSQETAEFTFIVCDAEMAQQYKCVAEKIIPKLLATEIPYSEIAIICGTNGEAIEMANVLRESEIPCYLVRWRFDNNTDIVHWLIDCAKWCEGSTVVSFDGLANFWSKLVESHEADQFLWDEIRLRTYLLEVIETSKPKTDLHEWLLHMINSLKLGDILEYSNRYPDERENLEALVLEAASGDLNSYDRLRFTRLGHPVNEVTVTTRHSVKGLEFEAIIMLGMEEGRFPYYTYADNSKEMKEAHRVCYVCVSRAKKICTLLHSKVITLPGKYGPWQKDYAPSRFWNALFEQFGSDDNFFKSQNF